MDSWIVANKLHGMAWQNVTLYGYGVISNDGRQPLWVRAIADKLVDMKSEVDQTDHEAKSGLGYSAMSKQEPRGKFPREYNTKKIVLRAPWSPNQKKGNLMGLTH